MSNTNDEFSDFRPMDKDSAADFEPYRYCNTFADTAFAMLYSWHKRFFYRYKMYRDVLAVTGVDTDGERIFILLRKNHSVSIDEAVAEICGLCRDEGRKAIFEYVASSEIPFYRQAAAACGRDVFFSYDDKYSDYIYETKKFVSMKGAPAKTKRGGYNFLMRNCPGIRAVPYTDSLFGVCVGIFDAWCAERKCGDCFYGCEKEAFRSFMEIYDPERHKILLAYDGNTPMSFLAYE